MLLLLFLVCPAAVPSVAPARAETARPRDEAARKSLLSNLRAHCRALVVTEARHTQQPTLADLSEGALMALLAAEGVELEADTPFARAGVDSLVATKLRNALQNLMGRSTPLPLTGAPRARASVA